MRKVSLAGFGAGGAVAVAGLLLYAFDQPAIDLSQRPPEERPKTTTPKREDPTMEMSALPVLSPGFLGGSVSVASALAATGPS